MHVTHHVPQAQAHGIAAQHGAPAYLHAYADCFKLKLPELNNVQDGKLLATSFVVRNSSILRTVIVRKSEAYQYMTSLQICS